MKLARGTRLGANELVMRVGRGGMASVWLARERHEDPERDRLVALKAMCPDLATESEFVSMFLDEVRLCRAVRHDNVIDVYDVGHHEGVMWMTMEWIDGDSLHAVFTEASKRHAVPLEIAVRIVADTASGLHAAHGLRAKDGSLLNLVHRDVSPHNILIAADGRIKLADFGIAKAIDSVTEKTRTGHLKGKFGYMSPEQVRGAAVDRRSDVFSLGIVLYELTTGRRLFRGRHELHTLELVLSGEIPLPSSVQEGYPPRLERILMKALERNADLRHPTAAAFEAELLEFLNTQQILVPRSGVARLLTRVLGPTLEQRRKAVRLALEELSRTEDVTEPELSLGTSREPGEHSEPSNASSRPAPGQTGTTGISSLSQVGPAVRTWRPSSGVGSQVPMLLASLALMLLTVYLVYQTRLHSAAPSVSSVAADAAASQPVPEQSPPVPEQSPPVPEQSPPVPEQSPPVPEQGPPVPEQSPPVPEQSPPVPERSLQAPSPQAKPASTHPAERSQIPLVRVEDLHVDDANSQEPRGKPPEPNTTSPLRSERPATTRPGGTTP